MQVSKPTVWMAHNLALAHELIGIYLSVQHPNTVVTVQYPDDMLKFGTEPNILRGDTIQLAGNMETCGLEVSPKSKLEPTTCIQWMGKHVDGVQHGFSNDANHLLALVISWVSLCTIGYSQHGL